MKALGLLTLLVVAALVPAATAAPRDQSPYPCGMCLFEVNANGKGQHIVLDVLSLQLSGDSGSALSPDRRYIAYSTPEPNGGENLMIARINGTHRRRIARGVDARWSPDGSKLAFLGAGGISVINTDGRGLHHVASGRTTGLSWSPDSRQLAFVERLGGNGSTGFLSVVGSAGGRVRSLAIVEGDGEIAWLPNSRALAYTSAAQLRPSHGIEGSDGGKRGAVAIEIRVVSASGGRSKPLARGLHPDWSRQGRLAYQTWGPNFAEPPAADLIQYTPQRLRVRPGRALDRCCGLIGPRWAPSGKAIAYLGAGRGPRGAVTNQLFTVRPSGAGRRQVTKQLPGGLIEGIWWSRDAKQLFYLWEFTNVD